MSAEAVLSRSDHVRPTGKGRWIANCCAHKSKSKQSLSIRELNDGRVLLHCWGGCDVEEILSALGLDFTDLYPPQPLAGHGNARERRPFSANDALRCISRECTYVAVVANELARGDSLADADRERLLIAAGRINTALEVFQL